MPETEDNVRSLRGEPIQGRPIAEVVEELERLMVLARSGKIRELAVAMISDTGMPESVHLPSCSPALLGASVLLCRDVEACFFPESARD